MDPSDEIQTGLFDDFRTSHQWVTRNCLAFFDISYWMSYLHMQLIDWRQLQTLTSTHSHAKLPNSLVSVCKGLVTSPLSLYWRELFVSMIVCLHQWTFAWKGKWFGSSFGFIIQVYKDLQFSHSQTEILFEDGDWGCFAEGEGEHPRSHKEVSHVYSQQACVGESQVSRRHQQIHRRSWYDSTPLLLSKSQKSWHACFTFAKNMLLQQYVGMCSCSQMRCQFSVLRFIGGMLSLTIIWSRWAIEWHGCLL